ncbi:MAG: succinate dehydrogenase, cytochrome b556 subunit [Rhodospirillales bacterium]|nr:succinate dehydrogenase, cytochrome b556 subunit [Rhodospirillales bacterium]
MTSRERPLSPHLQIYKWQITMALSILHRMTGVALVVGALLLSYWLTSAAYGPEAFNLAHGLFGTILGRLVLLGLTFSLFYHLGNGVRHLFWDVGMGFEMPNLRASGIAVVVFAVVFTLLTWSAAYIVRGG